MGRGVYLAISVRDHIVKILFAITKHIYFIRTIVCAINNDNTVVCVLAVATEC